MENPLDRLKEMSAKYLSIFFFSRNEKVQALLGVTVRFQGKNYVTLTSARPYSVICNFTKDFYHLVHCQ